MTGEIERDCARFGPSDWPAPLAMIVAACLASPLACGGLPHPRYTAQPTEALALVGYPPPPARVELIPKKPRDGAVWVDGEWSWAGSKWRWKRGRWVEPVPTERFSPWTTVRDDHGNVYFAAGVWRGAAGQKVEAPPALALAHSLAGDVISADGDDEKTAPTADPTSATKAAP